MNRNLIIGTWNINSVRIRLPIVKKLLKTEKPDILCLQEIKCQEHDFPVQFFRDAGYEHVAVRGQKGYHGVATVSRLPFKNTGTRDFCGKTEARHVETTVSFGGQDLRLHNFYVPAGGDEPDRTVNEKFGYKLDFLAEMAEWLTGEETNQHSVLVGDLNVAPYENDVWSHQKMLKVVSHTPEEVDLYEKARKAGKWIDALREFVPMDEKFYTWWSYRSQDWSNSDKGRRLDHIWVTPHLKDNLKSVGTVRNARGWDSPSDHVPLLAKLGL